MGWDKTFLLEMWRFDPLIFDDFFMALFKNYRMIYPHF